MRVLVTYHPAAYLHAGKTKGVLTKETLLTCIREDLQKLAGNSVELPPPKERGYLEGKVFGVDTEYGGKGGSTLYTVALATGDSTYLVGDIGDVTGKEYLGGVYPIGGKNPIGGIGDRDIGSSETLRGFTPSPKGIILTPLGIEPLGREGVVLVAHSSQGDLQHLWEQGLIPKDPRWLTGEGIIDSYTVARMAYENHPSYKLEDLFANFYTFEGWKHETRKKSVDDWSPEERRKRCALDAWATYKVAEHEWPKVDPALYLFTQRTTMALNRMTLAGAFIDWETFQQIKRETEIERARLLQPLITAALYLGMTAFEPTNDHHLRRILYDEDKLNLPALDFTRKKNEPKVTKEVLKQLTEIAQGGSKEFLETLIAYNAADKVYSTYVTGLWDDEAKEGLMYPLGRLADQTEVAWLPFNFHTLGAKTGRRSSSEPNSQNWPKKIRSYVRSRWIGGSVLECDYRKLEPVIIAWLCKSQKLLDFFVKGGGYIDIAKELFRTEVKEGTLLYRGVKSIVLGVHYDMQTPLMAEELWTKNGIRFSADYREHTRITDEIRRKYLAAFPEIAVYFEGKWAFLDANGYVESPTGRRRRLGQSPGKHERNQAINFPVQSCASDVTGAALCDVELAILEECGVSLVDWYDTLLAARRYYLTMDPACGTIQPQYGIPVLFNEVHDSLLVDLPPGWKKRGTELVVETMRAVPSLRQFCSELKGMPLNVDVKLGPRWGG